MEFGNPVFLTRQMLSGGGEIMRLSDNLMVQVSSPYLIVQSIRALLWSKRSLTGTKWANLYFALLLTGLGGWSLKAGLGFILSDVYPG